MIFFDLDGTLIDSNGLWEEIDLAFLGRRGLIPTEEYTHTVGHSIFPIAAQFTRDYYHLDLSPRAIMDEWLEGGRAAYAQVDMKPGARAFLDRCRAAGAPMALLTACVPELCQAALRRHGLEDYFVGALYAEQLGLEKKRPEVYHLALEQFGVGAGDCTFFEDAPANCAAAKTAGITVVGVYDPFYAKYRKEMEGICDRYIVSFEELITGEDALLGSE